MNELNGLIGIIISQSFILIGSMVKIWWNQRVSDRRMTTREKEWKLSMMGVEDKLNQLVVSSSRAENKEQFKIDLINAIQTRMSSNFILFDTSYPKFSFILSVWAEFIEKFSRLYWDSNFRKEATPPKGHGTVESLHLKNKKEDLKVYLKSLLLAKENDLIELMDTKIQGLVQYDRHKIRFSELFKNTKLRDLGELTPKNELLTLTLVKNGFDNSGEAFINEIDNYLAEFFEYIKDNVKLWHSISTIESVKKDKSLLDDID